MLTLGGLVHCSQPDPGDLQPSPPAGPTRSAEPVDYVRPGEVAEGKERAFGFPVPRGMRIRGRFPDAVYAEGRLPFVPLANYVRERVEAERVETGPSKTVFDAARLKSNQAQIVRIEVTSRSGKIELVVRDQSRRPSAASESEAERWKRSGLSPDGKPLPELEE